MVRMLRENRVRLRARGRRIAGDGGDASEVVALIEIRACRASRRPAWPWARRAARCRRARARAGSSRDRRGGPPHPRASCSTDPAVGRPRRRPCSRPPSAVCAASSRRASSEALAGDERDQCDQRDRGDSPRQGRREASLVAAPPAPAGVPQRWQNFAPGVSCAPHATQATPTRAAPQVGAEPPARRGAARRTGLCSGGAGVTEGETDPFGKATRLFGCLAIPTYNQHSRWLSVEPTFQRLRPPTAEVARTIRRRTPAHSRRIPPARRSTTFCELTEKLGVRFMRLQFTDILGINKNVEIPSSQFEKALAGDIMFDGSSIEGFVRIEESDMLLAPDLDTFLVFPWGDAGQADLPADLRHPHARGRAVRGRSARARSRRVLAQGARRWASR